MHEDWIDVTRVGDTSRQWLNTRTGNTTNYGPWSTTTTTVTASAWPTKTEWWPFGTIVRQIAAHRPMPYHHLLVLSSDGMTFKGLVLGMDEIVDMDCRDWEPID